MKTIENLIEYIEGPTSKAVVEHKKAQEAEAKKQQKKLKAQQQKIRRQVEQQIESLKDVNGDIQEVTIEIKQIQNQLTQLKAGKGKKTELKRIKTAEDKLLVLEERRKKIESFVKGMEVEVKNLCPDINFVDECRDLKGILGIVAPEILALEKKEKIPIKNQQAPSVLKLIQPPAKPISPSNSTSLDEDPAKRMVTIRRVNIPHAEPQVTVTAKGTTPDMDQLLYTFVNGQLVPASNLSPNAFQNANGAIQLFMSDNNGLTKMPVNMIPVESQPPKESKKKEKEKESLQKKVEKQTSKEEKKKKSEKKKEVTKKETKEQEKKEQKEEKKKKVKKVYIDPEYAANPFKLLDDDGGEITDETEEEVEVEKNEVDELVEEMKKVQVTQTAIKNEKNEKKKQQGISTNQKSSKVMERQESVNSNNSKDSKQSKKQQKKIEQQQQQNQHQNNIHSFPLHPQYQQHSGSSQPHTTVYKPADYVNANKKSSQQHAAASHNQASSAHSIMDQLNRGVKVEGLRLPPGITLTKVTPSNAEIHHQKRESINRVSFVEVSLIAIWTFHLQ